MLVPLDFHIKGILFQLASDSQRELPHVIILFARHLARSTKGASGHCLPFPSTAGKVRLGSGTEPGRGCAAVCLRRNPGNPRVVASARCPPFAEFPLRHRDRRTHRARPSFRRAVIFAYTVNGHRTSCCACSTIIPRMVTPCTIIPRTGMARWIMGGRSRSGSRSMSPMSQPRR